MIKPRAPMIIGGNPLARGLVFNMAFFEGGGTTPIESVTNTRSAFAGTPNPTWKNSLFGAGLDYTGTASAGEAVYYTPSSTARGLMRYSIEALLMFRTAGAGNAGTYFRNTDNTNTQITLRVFDVNANSILFSHRWTTTAGAWRVTGLTANTPYHVVVTYDGTSSSNVPIIYINGASSVLTTTTSPVGTIDSTADSQFVIGNINQTGNVGTRTWDGQIYKISFYNRILNDQEVKQLYANPWQIYAAPRVSLLNSLASTAYQHLAQLLGMGM